MLSQESVQPMLPVVDLLAAHSTKSREHAVRAREQAANDGRKRPVDGKLLFFILLDPFSWPC
jgi:hypothetical protein